ncbi:hypothetical protein [Zhongshania sp.]|uniref:hypothetical protein n=1 Tax=Zhongshania sp. TaxID=1971902 RepID=UPI0039E715A5
MKSMTRGVHAVLEVLAGGDPPEKLMERDLKEGDEAAEFHMDAFKDDEANRIIYRLGANFIKD